MNESRRSRGQNGARTFLSAATHVRTSASEPWRSAHPLLLAADNNDRAPLPLGISSQPEKQLCHSSAMISIWLSPLRLKVLLTLAVSMRLGSLLAQQTNSQAESEAILAMYGRRNLIVHDPSTIVKCKNEYWLFATGNGIVSKHSPDLVNWTNGPRVFTNSPSWVRETVPGNYGHFWAPDVIHLTDGDWLYYAV